MLARNILDNKGHEVATIAPEATVRDAVGVLAQHNVGALVVSPDGEQVVGIISERDVVRRLGAAGVQALDEPVQGLMMAEVRTCSPAETADQLMETMTAGRFRHVPVVEDGRLVGIVSIGDVVKVRIDELATEREQLAGYIAGG